MNSIPRALVCRIIGQDGAYLSKFLRSKGFVVAVTSLDAQISTFSNLSRLGIRHSVSTLSMALNDIRSVIQVLKEVQPDEVYNLSGQSSVSLSF